MSNDFGAAVRRWRDRVRPESAGLTPVGQRRAAGLRREELALLAGISADYVTRLEQGRASHPSDQVVEALARALRLSETEREHLFRLAGLVPPGRDRVPGALTPSVHRLLERLAGTPVAVFDAAWTLLLANPLHTALLGERPAWREHRRNGVWWTFTGAPGRVRQSPEERRATEVALVADLRATASRYPADPELSALVTELRAASPRFAELWASGTVGRHVAARKTVDHPDVGSLTLDCDILTVAGDDLRVMVYTAEPGTTDADALTLLATRVVPTLAAV
ncbi:helix-turn-helix transcriptional regulator [Streptomyces sp. VRA16 Mangrove soil]|uniref:helix-turn-helix transcriptional regulator n=1 Tax=Streptomyces sp. VRA16 Mangrove soil TaxID=2817434 RepID=UPI001A9EB794|nr:helix-turn-helix transcriptional regulator [Streptomyces sp. VRA16 Mangrove soil]MBO1337275.1 helix-turn-helix domain-containing protein [Streptomyces sp. VRA16 Mangrove soil]